MANPYLISAYVFTLLLFGYYGWSIARRKARLRRELEGLKDGSPKP